MNYEHKMLLYKLYRHNKHKKLMSDIERDMKVYVGRRYTYWTD